MSSLASQPIVILGGGAVAAALAAWIWIGWTASDFERTSKGIRTGEAEYKKLYPEKGLSAADAKERYESNLLSQKAQLESAEKALIVELPPDYRQTDKNEVTAKLGSVTKDLQLYASGRSIPIPALPFANVTVADTDDLRQIQLLKAFMMRRSLETVLEAEIERVTELIIREPAADPNGRIVVLTASLVIDAGQRQSLTLIDRLRQQHVRGLGIREMTLSPLPDQRASVRLVLSLLLQPQHSGIASEDQANPGKWLIRLPREGAPGEATLVPPANNSNSGNGQSGAPLNPFNR